MVKRWASDTPEPKDAYEALHEGLTVDLICTPVASLKTCKPDDLISDVIKQNPDDFDFLPVVDENNRFIGMFCAAEHRHHQTLDTVWRCFSPLSEKYLIGADASILDFLLDADQRQCRLVLSRSKIVGLVSLSDLQKLPVRAAIFALVTGLEITMAQRIREFYPADADWLCHLASRRQEKIEEERRKAKDDDSYVDALLFTQFCDKRDILEQHLPKERRRVFSEALNRIECLRNNIAHANEYASSLTEAKTVCEVIRELLLLRNELRRLD
ncbi:CBS domain-containing protein [Bradyrhizobium sp.]|uniref:CBS domain-containing protein n=1 Tax=Bradyrhizobium sp. TaxID=376 RepID=UPI002D5458F1|nr:CBS domain-containing protein [Bradyrhizobium sp.]HZR75122.1 CBS domain-containing protein [Bradyrhizobium sp.]